MKLALKLLVLTLALFVLQSLDYAGLGLSETLRTAPLPALLAAFLSAAALAFAIRRARPDGVRLALAVFLVYYGTAYFLVAVEAVYLTDLLSPGLALRIFVNGAITAALFSPLAVWALGRWSAAQGDPGPDRLDPGPTLAPLAVLLRLGLAGAAWVILFVLVGALVFQPVAIALDPDAARAYLAAFAGVDPGRVLGLQFARGAVWALLALPLLRRLRGPLSRVGLALAVLFAGLMAANLLIPAGLPVSIQLAHLAEVALENFAFGWVVAALFWTRKRFTPESRE